MTTDDHTSPSAPPFGVTDTAVITGMRPARREPVMRDSLGDAGSVWAPVAAVAWLLALTPGAVIATRTGFFMPALIAVFQVGLIVVVLMRFAWGKRIHLLVLGIGVLLCTLLLTMISLDRREYRSEIERFDTTVRGVVDRPGD